MLARLSYWCPDEQVKAIGYKSVSRHRKSALRNRRSSCRWVILRMVRFGVVRRLCQESWGSVAGRATTLVKESLGATTCAQAYNSVSTESVSYGGSHASVKVFLR
jgi:hypothetical protein